MALQRSPPSSGRWVAIPAPAAVQRPLAASPPPRAPIQRWLTSISSCFQRCSTPTSVQLQLLLHSSGCIPPAGVQLQLLLFPSISCSRSRAADAAVVELLLSSVSGGECGARELLFMSCCGCVVPVQVQPSKP